MNTKKMFTLLALVAAPALAFASSMDSQIEAAARGSYNYRAVLDNNIKVKSRDGVVTLSGTVQDRDQKALAEDTARNLPGVVEVRNHIKVEGEPAEHSDGMIALKIRGVLLVRANVSATSTKVTVNDGVVLLTGTVKNLAQKELTEAYVKDIEGVKSVRNELVIKADADDSAADANVVVDGNSRTAGEKIDDASITTQVKIALLAHRSTSAIKTKVTTRDGVVMVSGEAANDAEKDLVSKLAQSVRGVRSVDNDMTVRSN